MRPIGSWRPTGRPALRRSISMDNSSGTGEKLAGHARLGTWLDRAARPGLAEHDGKIELVRVGWVGRIIELDTVVRLGYHGVVGLI